MYKHLIKPFSYLFFRFHYFNFPINLQQIIDKSNTIGIFIFVKITAMPNIQVYNFKSIIRGDSCVGLRSTVRVSSVMDFTGVKIYFIIYMSDGFILEQSTDNGGISVLDTVGKCVFQINEFICSIKPGNYTYKLKFQYPNGKIRTYLTGSFRVINE
jgi:hypothetical protein